MSAALKLEEFFEAEEEEEAPAGPPPGYTEGYAAGLAAAEAAQQAALQEAELQALSQLQDLEFTLEEARSQSAQGAREMMLQMLHLLTPHLLSEATPNMFAAAMKEQLERASELEVHIRMNPCHLVAMKARLADLPALKVSLETAIDMPAGRLDLRLAHSELRLDASRLLSEFENTLSNTQLSNVEVRYG